MEAGDRSPDVPVFESRDAKPAGTDIPLRPDCVISQCEGPIADPCHRFTAMALHWCGTPETPPDGHRRRVSETKRGSLHEVATRQFMHEASP
jgi:hypothetical protein